MPSSNDAAVRVFLRRSLVTQVATLSPKGRPFLTPLWFVARHGVLYITTGPETWAGRNVQHHPAVTLLFSGERAGHPRQVLRLRGTATCHRGLPSWAVLLRVAAKYYLSPRALRVELRNARRWRLRTLYYGQAKGGLGYIRVVPNAYEFLRQPDGTEGGRRPSSRRSVTRPMALILGLVAWLVGVPLAHGVVPWGVSLLTRRHGWTESSPGMCNVLGLIPVVVATACLIWIMVTGFAHADEMPERVGLNWDPKLLLVRGPYAFSRHPMYVAELTLWLGWTLFYGSLAVFVGFLILGTGIRLIVGREERDLEARFGEAYRQYEAAVPRWLALRRHRADGA